MKDTENKALYDKERYEANKEKKKADSRAYYTKNKEKRVLSQKLYRDNNRQSLKAYNKKLSESEGIGVYKATYPSGIYIGSGQIYSRKSKHINGSSTIAKTLKEKATSFEVICLTDNVNDARVKEQKIIDWYGLDNLLNNINAKRRA